MALWLSVDVFYLLTLSWRSQIVRYDGFDAEDGILMVLESFM